MHQLKTLTVNGTTYEVASVVPATSVTLLAKSWVDSGEAYSQVVTVPGATPHTKVDLQPTAAQLAEFNHKVLAFVAENDAGVVTVYAVGDKPTSDHTIQTTLTEVEASGKIRGNTVGTPTPRTDFNQTDPAKADYLHGREKIVQTVNGVAPDENGNVNVTVPGSGGNVDLTGYVKSVNGIAPDENGNVVLSGGSGESGITPHIGDNGNWFIGETDTGKPSRGQDGKTPVKGVDYFTPEEIQEIAEQAAEMVEVPEGGGGGLSRDEVQTMIDEALGVFGTISHVEEGLF
jgi:hypothetical protein